MLLWFAFLIILGLVSNKVGYNRIIYTRHHNVIINRTVYTRCLVTCQHIGYVEKRKKLYSAKIFVYDKTINGRNRKNINTRRRSYNCKTSLPLNTIVRLQKKFKYSNF